MPLCSGKERVCGECIDSISFPSYSLHYSINNVTGEVFTGEQYDYETVQNFTVAVVASDRGTPQMMSETTLTVLITDTNDNSPVFSQMVYETVSLSENSTVGHSVMTVQATDDDSGSNAAITYTLAYGQGRFFINGNGTISLIAPLDREITELYEVVILAEDEGQPSRSASAALNITVSDVNDNPPQFNQTFYLTQLSEDTSSGTVIQTVFATDADIGTNAEIMFEIADGDPYNLFRIESQNNDTGYEGRLLLNTKADYENETSFSIRIIAHDQGSPSLSSTAHVTVIIVNTNDNSPMFLSSSYTFSVAENSVVGTPVGTVVANDDDAGTFGVITSYSFAIGTDPTVTSNFSISSTTGIITVGASLDHERQAQYQFAVAATDGGGVSSTAQVVVEVLNINEGAPQFSSQFYTANVSENLDPNQFVITVTKCTWRHLLAAAYVYLYLLCRLKPWNQPLILEEQALSCTPL